jgi:hypothetical protein
MIWPTVALVRLARMVASGRRQRRDPEPGPHRRAVAVADHRPREQHERHVEDADEHTHRYVDVLGREDRDADHSTVEEAVGDQEALEADREDDGADHDRGDRVDLAEEGVLLRGGDERLAGGSGAGALPWRGGLGHRVGPGSRGSARAGQRRVVPPAQGNDLVDALGHDLAVPG